jgi:hypothetical protein
MGEGSQLDQRHLQKTPGYVLLRGERENEDFPLGKEKGRQLSPLLVYVLQQISASAIT